jgi:glycosyltransferase involved in cell wall biosynthesis
LKILVTAQDKRNQLLWEIFSHLEERHTIVYSSELSDQNIKDFDLINIQWPEALTNWRVPSKAQLKNIENILNAASCIICTRHNYSPHKIDHPNTERLYQLVYQKSSGVIHLGEYSQQEYKARYLDIASKQKHIVIPHPLYTSYLNTKNKTESRQILGIPQSREVVLVFGNIRHATERNFILKSFRKLNHSRKLLLVSNMLPPYWYTSYNFRGKSRLFRFENYMRKKVLKQYFFFGRISNEKVQLFLNAADIVFIPRSNVLNSGIPFLGWSFKKVVVAPDCGNISESMRTIKHPLYNQGDSNSAVEAIKMGLQMATEGEGEIGFQRATKHFHPKTISQKTEHFFQKMLIFQD